MSNVSQPLPLAVVTGASRGIGLELCRSLLGRGHDVVMVADSDLVHDAAAELRSGQDRADRPDSAGRTIPIQADLATSAGVERLHTSLRELGRPIDVLALNAGIGLGGRFVESDLHQTLEIVDLDVRGTVHLARLVVPEMVARRRGRVLITSSIASTMPGSYQAVYNASKSFLQSFAIALRDELHDSEVTVTSLMPGPTDTFFFARAKMLSSKVAQGHKDDPAAVAEDGVEALLDGKANVVAGSIRNDLRVGAGRFLPDRAKAAMHRWMARPRETAAPS